MIFMVVGYDPRGHNLDVNVRVASHPAVDSPIYLPHGCPAKPPLLHGHAHDCLVVGLVVEADSDHPAVDMRRGCVSADDGHRTVRSLGQCDRSRTEGFISKWLGSDAYHCGVT